MNSLSRFQLVGITTSVVIGLTFLSSCNTMIVGRHYHSPEIVAPDAGGAYNSARQSENSAPSSIIAGQNYQNWSAGAIASWQLDFLGGVRRAIESSDTTAKAIEEAYRDTLVTLYAEVPFSTAKTQRQLAEESYLHRRRHSHA